MTEEVPPAKSEGDARGSFKTLVVFALGFVLAGVASLAALRPDLVRLGLEKYRYGTTSNGGVVLTAAQTEDGQGLRVAFTNISDQPLAFMLAKGEDELIFELERDGVRVEAPPPSPPPDDAPTHSIEPLLLPPGGTVENVVPLGRVIPGPGRYRVVVERVPLQPDKLRLRSNAAMVTRP
jgi:hypothetical protein